MTKEKIPGGGSAPSEEVKNKEGKMEKEGEEKQERQKEKDLEKLLSPDVKIGDLVKHEQEIEDFDDKDFEFENEEQYKLFKETVEKDERFKEILENPNDFLNESGELDLLDSKKVEALAEKTKDLPMIEKYIGLIYFGSEHGAGRNEDKTKRHHLPNGWYIKPKKEGGPEFPYRITDFPHEKEGAEVFGSRIVKAFSLEDMYIEWDGETSLNNPLNGPKSKEPGRFMNWTYGDQKDNSQIENIIVHYLREQGTDITNKKQTKEKLKERLHVDKKLTSILEKSGFSEKELNKVLGINNVFEDFRDVKSKIEKLEKGYNYLLKNDKVVFDTGYGGASSDKGWDVRVTRSIINIIGPDTNQQISLPDNYRFEDFPGGQTYRYPENKVKEIKDLKETKKEYIIEYIDGNDKKRTKKVERKDNVIAIEKAEKMIGEIIKKEQGKWLSSGNKEPVMNVHKYGESESSSGNYPHCAIYKIKGNEAYLAMTKVIDAERYDELLIEGREQGVIFDPQLKTEVHRINLKTGKDKSIGEKTTDRNKTMDKVLNALEDHGNIEFVTKPEILFVDGKVKVTLKARKGGEWVDIVLYGEEED